jgi:hypothetical protein
VWIRDGHKSSYCWTHTDKFKDQVALAVENTVVGSIHGEKAPLSWVTAKTKTYEGDLLLDRVQKH